MARILLIEDNELNRDMLSRRLRRVGYEVTVAPDAASGMRAAREEIPDVILLDLRLPDMSGWDVTALLKEDDRTNRIPILALTAHAMEGDRERAIAAGCDDYDIKPIQLPRLLQKIDALRGRGNESGGTVFMVPPPN